MLKSHASRPISYTYYIYLASALCSSFVAANIGSFSRAVQILLRKDTTSSVFSSIILVEENWTKSCCNSSSLRNNLNRIKNQSYISMF